MQAVNYAPPPSVGAVHSVEERRSALYEIVYLVLVINLYVASLFAPLLGIITGIFLLVGGTHPQTKRVGKVALICAGVGVVLTILVVLVWGMLVGAAATMAS